MTKTRLPPIGFLSYARRDDELSGQKLSKLRRLIKAELQLQYGRDTVKLFQDVSTIPHGAAWERETLKALSDSTFFVPIITPNFIQSEWCWREVNIFLERERQLFALHPDLPPLSRIFPIDYRRIRDGNACDPEALEILKKRQWCDFQNLRDKNPDEETVSRAIYDFAESICDLLSIEVVTPPTAGELAARKTEAEAARKQAEAAKRKEAAGARKRERDEEKRRVAERAEDARVRALGQANERQDASLPEEDADRAEDWHGRRGAVAGWLGRHALLAMTLGFSIAVAGVAATLWIGSSDRSPDASNATGPVANESSADTKAGSNAAAEVNGTASVEPKAAPGGEGGSERPARRNVAIDPMPRAEPQPPPPARVESASGHTIMLGAFSSPASAENAWQAISGRFRYVAPLIHRVATGSIGGRSVYRLFASGANARDACNRLRAAGEHCIPLD